jgi:sarcosine dehydrogenase
MEDQDIQRAREALEKIKQQPLAKILAVFTTDAEDIVLSGRETILRNGAFAGYLTSGGYGYTVERPIGFGYVRNAEGVDAAYLQDGSYELVVAQEKVNANIHLKPIYDSLNQRVKS